MQFAVSLVIASVLAVSSSSALAASYLKTDSTIVDPTLFTPAAGGGAHTYSGIDLEPLANLMFAELGAANLAAANLTAANLVGALLEGAELGGADLTGADLIGVAFTNVDLTDAKLFGADLTGSYMLGESIGTP